MLRSAAQDIDIGDAAAYAAAEAAFRLGEAFMAEVGPQVRHRGAACPPPPPPALWQLLQYCSQELRAGCF